MKYEKSIFLTSRSFNSPLLNYFCSAVCDILYLNAKEEPLSRIYSGLYYKKHAAEWEWFNLFIYDTGNKRKKHVSRQRSCLSVTCQALLLLNSERR